MIISVNVHEEGNWYVGHVKAERIEFSAFKPGYVIVDEGRMLIPWYDIISITDKRKG